MHMGRAAGAIGLVVALAAGCQASLDTATPLATAATPAPVSYKQDVAPLIAGRCAACHRQGGEAASAATLADAQGKADYAGIKARINDIISDTRRGRMPEGGPRFTAAEVAILQAWKDAGTPDN
jgi:mono/diheme cytochrome c family protein